MKNNKIQLTQTGLTELQAELVELKEVRRPKLVARLSNARDQGDLSENSDYIGAKEELAFMDDRIDELEDLLSNAQLAPQTTNETVNIGNTVTVKIISTKKQTTFHIVGEWEANPMDQKISDKSPLGAALHGKKVGDKAQVKAPAGVAEYEILKIE